MPITENTFFYSHQLSNEDYHADPAIGSSGLKKFMECPALYYAHYINPKGKENRPKSDALTFGSQAHLKLLEPDVFEESFMVSEEFSVLKSGENKGASVPMNKAHASYKSFAAECRKAGKEPLLHSDFEMLCEMAAMLKNDPLINACFTGVGQNECSFFAKDEITGLVMKSRPDRVVNLQGVGGYKYIIIDYKTTAGDLGDVAQEQIKRREKRHLQAASHIAPIEGIMNIKIDAVIYICQSKEYPYLARAFELDPGDIEIGNDERRNALDGYTDHKGIYHKGLSECAKDGIWPSYSGITKYQRLRDYV